VCEENGTETEPFILLGASSGTRGARIPVITSRGQGLGSIITDKTSGGIERNNGQGKMNKCFKQGGYYFRLVLFLSSYTRCLRRMPLLRLTEASS